jgi:hypothetical protein
MSYVQIVMNESKVGESPNVNLQGGVLGFYHLSTFYIKR